MNLCVAVVWTLSITSSSGRESQCHFDGYCSYPPSFLRHATPCWSVSSFFSPLKNCCCRIFELLFTLTLCCCCSVCLYRSKVLHAIYSAFGCFWASEHCFAYASVRILVSCLSLCVILHKRFSFVYWRGEFSEVFRLANIIKVVLISKLLRCLVLWKAIELLY